MRSLDFGVHLILVFDRLVVEFAKPLYILLPGSG
jgi:hypothetical protein